MNISISKDRVAVELAGGKIAQFVVWDLEESQHDDVKAQFQTAFALWPDFAGVERHLSLNGYEARLEDIFNG